MNRLMRKISLSSFALLTFGLFGCGGGDNQSENITTFSPIIEIKTNTEDGLSCSPYTSNVGQMTNSAGDLILYCSANEPDSPYIYYLWRNQQLEKIPNIPTADNFSLTGLSNDGAIFGYENTTDSEGYFTSSKLIKIKDGRSSELPDLSSTANSPNGRYVIANYYDGNLAPAGEVNFRLLKDLKDTKLPSLIDPSLSYFATAVNNQGDIVGSASLSRTFRVFFGEIGFIIHNNSLKLFSPLGKPEFAGITFYGINNKGDVIGSSENGEVNILPDDQGGGGYPYLVRRGIFIPNGEEMIQIGPADPTVDVTLYGLTDDGIVAGSYLFNSFLYSKETGMIPFEKLIAVIDPAANLGELSINGINNSGYLVFLGVKDSEFHYYITKVNKNQLVTASKIP
jgi:hypothetical protein